MVETRIHHVVVTSGGNIVGVVSSLDFVRAFVDRQ
jgi:signal-transduction protein with cAMP-binding, CBS, and nucleotidyltransferase domain